MSAGAWARDIARTYDALAENFESRPSTPANTLGAIANRAEAAKYHSIAARMDATGVSDRVAQEPGEQGVAVSENAERERAIKAVGEEGYAARIDEDDYGQRRAYHPPKHENGSHHD